MTKLINKLLSEREAARRLGLRIATLQRWRWAGKGPRFLKIEGAVRTPLILLTSLRRRVVGGPRMTLPAELRRPPQRC
jgi:hypothetical protein